MYCPDYSYRAGSEAASELHLLPDLGFVAAPGLVSDLDFVIDLASVLEPDFCLALGTVANAGGCTAAPIEALADLVVTDIDTDRAAFGSLAFAAKAAWAVT